MEKLKFSGIQPGLILMPFFPHIEPHNPAAHAVGLRRSVVVGAREYELGIAQIISCTMIKVRQVSDTLSCYMTGNPAYYLKTILSKKYPAAYGDDMLLDLMVFKYIHRRIPYTQEMLGKWWDFQIEQTPNWQEQIQAHKHYHD